MQQSGWGSARLPGSIVSPYIDSAAWQLDPIFSPEPFLSVKSPSATQSKGCMFEPRVEYSYKMVAEAKRPKTIGMLGTAFTTGASNA